jgi:putative oxidoreductase
MLRLLFRTDNHPAPLFLRLALGVVMFPHGAQKLFGWFGGAGFQATMTQFTESMGIPWALAVLVVLTESIGSVLLIVGALTRIAALGIGTVMVVAALKVHAQYGFFMNWRGQKAGEGFEFHILAAAIAVALVLRGGGLLSVDRRLAAPPRPRETTAPEG